MSQQKALFDAFAKSSATLHLSTENSNRALLALEQMFAKGKIQAQELRLQLGQAIPGAAARFQQAVLEMTKGTDLQGKSFDQLLQNGDLYTAKFLPALVQALQESSRGWEDASESLNAQLNRLSSNWFKLKSEVSGGLFNDAATQGIKFLANNLEHLVDVAGIAGGVLAGRLAGKGLQSGFGVASSPIIAARQAREAAAAEVARAEKISATAAVELKAAESAKQMIAQRQADGAALIAQNRSLAFNAQIQKDSALALRTKQLALAEASQSAMVLQVADERLIAAEAALVKAQAQVNAEMALAGPLSDRYAAAQARLVVA
jgi:tape measure domain-containing protein